MKKLFLLWKPLNIQREASCENFFRQMIQNFKEIFCVLPRIFVKYDGNNRSRFDRKEFLEVTLCLLCTLCLCVCGCGHIAEAPLPTDYAVEQASSADGELTQENTADISFFHSDIKKTDESEPQTSASHKQKANETEDNKIKTDKDEKDSEIQTEVSSTRKEPKKTDTQKKADTVLTPTKPDNGKSDKNSAGETTLPQTKETIPETAPTEETVVCTVYISCQSILNGKNRLKSEKQTFVPQSGIILSTKSIELPKGSTAFDALTLACQQGVCPDNCVYCQQNGIQLDSVYTPGYGNYYVRGIHQLYEKDCGSLSGWMYTVNGSFPNVGASGYTLQNGDEIGFLYTCELGEDLNGYHISD